MTEVVICGYARSAFTPAKKGQLSKTRPDDLAAEVIKGLLEKTGVKKEDVEDLIGLRFSRSRTGNESSTECCISDWASEECWWCYCE